ncbi:MAG: HD domain-containing protein [Gemmatimonadetes bacterium]|nr:HD domain-containing protein [Gemmatimonadota bacterium]MBI3567020.1 HD domain-containing protein [Gemmatimonadota bacterium]
MAERLLDTAVVQRLRYVRQLGLAHLVYPGATHSRFEHALGAHHLALRALRSLRESGQLDADAGDDPAVVAAAALLHDVGHYPFSHALEEIGVPNHEVVARPLVTEGEVAEVLRSGIGPDAPARVHLLICGLSASPLAGLISGSVDLDKIDYLKRDALMCGVPYGEIDEDRLIHAMVLVDDPNTGRRRIGVRDKGLSAIESLLFAKYQMYRNVYWHHACRSATAMYKRLVELAVADGSVRVDEVAGYTDEGLLHALESGSSAEAHGLLDALRRRRLHKRAFEAPAAHIPMERLEWISDDRPRTRRAEEALAGELKVPRGELLLDFPAKTQMLGLDLPVVARDGSVRHLTHEGLPGAIDLPRMADQLYRSARYLRVFTARRTVAERAVVLRVLENC